MTTEFAWQTKLDALVNEIKQVMDDEDLRFPYAAQRVIAQRLGYDVDEVKFVDGPGDRGIDFWYASADEIDIYQVKTHELSQTGDINVRTSFNNTGITSLMRAYHFLTSEESVADEHRLEELPYKLEQMARNHKARIANNPLHIKFSLVILGNCLTEPARNELATFEKTLEREWDYQGVPVKFHVELVRISDLLKEAWRKDNYEWINVSGDKRDTILLSPLRQSTKRDYLNDNNSAIFYCKAFDLIKSYEDFGYQIFEPNVRANIRNSPVNNAIQVSASHNRSMKEFRFLNNGITIVCTNYQLPAGQRPAFKVTKPGIINGLQTVTSLHMAYRKLSRDDKEYFEKNCHVLVRLLRKETVNHISDVVLATNNQNSMQPRNLVSNTVEQNHYATFFAHSLGWFYEAKQGAWNAFKQDHQSWRPRIDKRPRDFKAKKGFKTIDNHDLAQDWLAFLGFANDAFSNKKQLFDRERPYYELIFLKRSRNHAYNTYKSIQEAIKDSEEESPDPHMMLVAHLSRRFVHMVIPSTQASIKAALERREVYNREDISPAEEALILDKDREHRLNQILKTTPFVFVDYLGYSLFKVLGEKTHRIGVALLENHSWKDLKSNLNLETVVSKANNEQFDDSDLLLVMWSFFKEAVEAVMEGVWSTRFKNARSKSRFVLNNRHQIFEEMLKMDNAMKRKTPMRVYTTGFCEGEGIFDYLKRTVDEQGR